MPTPVIAPAPVLPLGGKTGIPIARGFIRIDDRDTPEDGSDDVITGTIEFGPFERNVATGMRNRVIESFDRVIHQIVRPAAGITNISSATPNEGGGFDYMIGDANGVAAFPALLLGMSADFPSEIASQSSADAEDTPFWLLPGTNGIARLEGVDAIVGLSTDASVWGYACKANAVGASCVTTASNWEADLYARFANVIIRLSTNADGQITQALGILVNEADQSTEIEGDDSWRATTLSFTGSSSTSPAAFDDRAILVTGRDAFLNIRVLDNDHPGVQPSVVTILGHPEEGTATVLDDPPGVVRYQPPSDAQFKGRVNITYQIEDADAQTDTGMAEVVVTDPVACQDDSVESGTNQAITQNVLVNDSGYDVPPITVTIASAPGQGTAVVNPNRTITFTPPEDVKGSFSIGYELSDGSLTAATCTLDVRVTAVPVAVNDGNPYPFPYRIVRGQTITVDVLANDTGLEDEPILVEIVAGDDGNPLVAGGTAVVNDDNTVTFTASPEFTGRWDTPGEVFILDMVGAFVVNEQVVVRDDSGNIAFSAIVSEVLADRLRVTNVGPTIDASPLAGAEITGGTSEATAKVGAGYVPPCGFGCFTSSGGAGFRYRIVDAEGQGSDAVALIDVFPPAVTDTGGSGIGAELLALLAGAGLLRGRMRRCSAARGRTRTGTTL